MDVRARKILKILLPLNYVGQGITKHF